MRHQVFHAEQPVVPSTFRPALGGDLLTTAATAHSAGCGQARLSAGRPQSAVILDDRPHQGGARVEILLHVEIARPFHQHVGDAELAEGAAVPVALGVVSAAAVSGLESFCMSYFASSFLRSSHGPTALPISGPCPRTIGSINPCQVCIAQLVVTGRRSASGPRSRSGTRRPRGPVWSGRRLRRDRCGSCRSPRDWCDTSRATPRRGSSSA